MSSWRGCPSQMKLISASYRSSLVLKYWTISALLTLHCLAIISRVVSENPFFAHMFCVSFNIWSRLSVSLNFFIILPYVMMRLWNKLFRITYKSVPDQFCLLTGAHLRIDSGSQEVFSPEMIFHKIKENAELCGEAQRSRRKFRSWHRDCAKRLFMDRNWLTGQSVSRQSKTCQ